MYTRKEIHEIHGVHTLIDEITSQRLSGQYFKLTIHPVKKNSGRSARIGDYQSQIQYSTDYLSQSLRIGWSRTAPALSTTKLPGAHQHRVCSRWWMPPTWKMRVWERGSGETWACGTGTCATVAALTELGICPAGRTSAVQLRGGELTIRVLPGKQLLDDRCSRDRVRGHDRSVK